MTRFKQYNSLIVYFVYFTTIRLLYVCTIRPLYFPFGYGII